jgi:hypothetical protein
LAEERALDLRDITHLVVAGWTGRDQAALEAHIRELEALGIARPKSTPIFYRVAASLLTTADRIEVIGGDSSGEAEVIIYALGDAMWLGLGSDHTDRKAEAIGVTLSKQMCGKPVGARLWRMSDVAPHWDRLVLRSFVTRDGKRRLYQEGPVATMCPPEGPAERRSADIRGERGDLGADAGVSVTHPRQSLPPLSRYNPPSARCARNSIAWVRSPPARRRSCAARHERARRSSMSPTAKKACSRCR